MRALLAIALLMLVPGVAFADPAPESVVGSGTVADMQFQLSVSGGPYGQNPTGVLHLHGAMTFDATPTCLNVAGDAGVVGFRIQTGPNAGKGFISASGPAPVAEIPASGPGTPPPPDPSGTNAITTAADQRQSAFLLYAGLLAKPPTACPPPSAPAPSTPQWIVGGSVTGTITHAGGPAVPLPLQQQQFDTPTPGAGPADLAQGDDGTLWFIEPAVNRIAAKANDMSARVTEYAVPTAAAGLSAIAADASGTCSNLGCAGGGMWFTESAADQIGHISSDGAIAEYPIPTANAAPSSIAGDAPDGGAWFTEPGADKIGHIDEAGRVTEYPLPTPGAEPASITADEGFTGPAGDGAWFTETAANKIGYIAGDGTITEYAVPTAGSRPTTIVDDETGISPTGAWFIEGATGTLAYIDSTGHIADYPVHGVGGIAAGLGPSGIDPGLWFSEPVEGELGFISDDGGPISKLTLPGAHPAELAVTVPLGAPALSGYRTSLAVWWSDPAGSRIGLARVPLAGPYVVESVGAPLGPPRAGSIVVSVAKRLAVLGSRITVRLRCVGRGACAGRVVLRFTSGRRTSIGVDPGTARFRLGAGHRTTLHLRLSAAALRTLRAVRSRHGALIASMKIEATTGRPPPPRTVTLRLVRP